MFILKKGHQPGVYVPLRALFLVCCLLLSGCLRQVLLYCFLGRVESNTRRKDINRETSTRSRRTTSQTTRTAETGGRTKSIGNIVMVYMEIGLCFEVGNSVDQKFTLVFGCKK